MLGVCCLAFVLLDSSAEMRAGSRLLYLSSRSILMSERKMAVILVSKIAMWEAWCFHFCILGYYVRPLESTCYRFGDDSGIHFASFLRTESYKLFVCVGLVPRPFLVPIFESKSGCMAALETRFSKRI